MTNLSVVIEDIKATVAPLMDRWVEDRVAALMELKEQIKTLDQNEEFNEYYNDIRSRDRYFSRSSAKFYWFGRQGYTKGDYMLAAYDGKAYIEEKMKKEAAAKLKKIDVAVAKKIDFDVNSIEKLYFNTTGKDGYVEGAWKINGEKVFSFDTIYAGGYNIQRLHVRTKYKLK